MNLCVEYACVHTHTHTVLEGTHTKNSFLGPDTGIGSETINSKPKEPTHQWPCCLGPLQAEAWEGMAVWIVVLEGWNKPWWWWRVWDQAAQPASASPPELFGLGLSAGDFPGPASHFLPSFSLVGSPWASCRRPPTQAFKFQVMEGGEGEDVGCGEGGSLSKNGGETSAAFLSSEHSLSLSSRASVADLISLLFRRLIGVCLFTRL